MKRWLAPHLIILMAIFIFQGEAICHGKGAFHEGSDLVPQPAIIEPKTDEVDISGRDSLKFSWSPHERGRGFRDRFDVRICRTGPGGDSGTIFKEGVGPEIFELNVTSSLFDDGALYRFEIRQVYNNSQKSRWSHETFRVIKKAK